MAPPPLRILEGSLSLIERRSLVMLCEAGVPDALMKPTAIEDLAQRLAATWTPTSCSACCASPERKAGFGSTGEGGSDPPASPDSFAAIPRWVGGVGGLRRRHGDHLRGAVLALTRPGDSFAEVNGAPYFDWMEQHPVRWSVFDAAMAAGAQMHDMALDVSLDLECAAGLCDVGGGTGELARTLHRRRRVRLDPGRVLRLPLRQRAPRLGR